jgi:hypothetical protein
MANKKITQLTDIGSSITGTDILHIIDDPAGTPINKKLTIDNLFGNIPGLLNLSQVPQQLSTNDSVSLSEVVTILTPPNNTTNTLLNGNTGQLKFIVMASHGGGNLQSSVIPSTLIGGTAIKFTDVGHSVLLLYTSYGWAIISNNGTTIV